MKRLLFLFASVFCVSGLYAQVTLDNNPFSLKWYQVNTKHFRVLYPEGFEVQAQRMGNTLEHIHGPESRTMGSSPRKISVVLQNQSSISNAFVSITPRRTEFYTMPSQDYNFLATNDWLNLIASHEYRHVVQFQHSNRGLSKAFYYLFGAGALSVLSHAAAPNWFWEGDAVATETAFTHGGRGRIPNFGLVFKTNLMEGRTFNYQKQYLRSYKNNIPDHYVLGYHMVSYLRKRTNDPEIWGKITARAWNIPIIPFRFSSAIKMETGLTVNGLYRAMAVDLKKNWQEEISKLQLTPFEKVNSRTSKAYTDYSFPQPLDDGSILVMKSGIGSIEKFCKLKDGKELKGFTPGFMNQTGMLSTAGSVVVWNEFGYDPRWGVRNYSLIKGYDFKKRQKYVIGDKKERYAGAALSPDGTKIVTVRSAHDYKVSLRVLSFPNGNVLKEFTNPENYFYSMPRWSDDGSKIIALKTTPQGKTISLIDAESGSVTDLLPVTNENVGYPTMNGSYIFYNSAISGIDNIYAIDLKSNTTFQVTSSKYGAYNPVLSRDGKSIYYNEQVRDGLDVVRAPFDPSLWKTVEKQQTGFKSLADNLAEQEGRSGLFDSIPHDVLPVKRYSKFKGIINPHSWGPLLDNDLTHPYVALSSQDVLSTTSINAGYQFDIYERTGIWKAGVSYQGFYPIIDLSFSHSKRSDKEDYTLTEWRINQKNDTIKNYTAKTVKFQWKELNVEAGLRVPLNFTNSKYSTAVTIADYVGYTSITDFSNSIYQNRDIPVLIRYDTIEQDNKLVPRTSTGYYTFKDHGGPGNLVYNKFSLTAYRLLKQSRRDINSKWGQVLYLDVYNTPLGGDYSGSNFSAYGVMYFPGLFNHHSFWGYVAYQNTGMKENENLYYFRNRIPLPRGLNQYISRFQNFYSMSANYTLPLWYPDIHIGPLLNVQRVRLNGFIDYGFGQTQTESYKTSQSFTSVGGDVKFDFNVMRFLPQFNVGFRYSQGLTPSVSKFEILIGAFNF